MLNALVQPFGQPLWACILSQLFGVTHMKLGAAPELRSLISAQSVPVHVEFVGGFARTILPHRVEL